MRRSFHAKLIQEVILERKFSWLGYIIWEKKEYLRQEQCLKERPEEQRKIIGISKANSRKEWYKVAENEKGPERGPRD